MENISSKIEVEEISDDFAFESGALGDLSKMTDEDLRQMAAKM